MSLSRRIAISDVMQAITNCGPISRASISKQTGMSKQIISEIVLTLETDGWVRETGRTTGHVGRSAVTYELVPQAGYVASIDLGGTKVRAAIVDLGCRVVAELTEPTDPKGGAAVAEQIGRICKAAAETAGINVEKLFCAVVGVPGVPDAQTGSVGMAPNIKDIDRIDFAQKVGEALGVPVQMENDVNLAAIGEHWAGCGANVDDLVFVSLGTGIGAGLIVGGDLLRGSTGSAGELGYLPFGANPFEAESLRAGALESMAGSSGIINGYAELTGKTLGVPAIFDLAEAGDPHAIAILRRTARLISRLIATIGVVVNPSLIVMGGSIGQRGELKAMIEQELATCFPFPLAVRQSELGAHAAIIGGAAIGLTRLHHRFFAEGLTGIDLHLPRPMMPALSREMETTP